MPAVIGLKEKPEIICFNRGTIERLSRFWWLNTIAKKLDVDVKFEHYYPQMGYFASGLVRNNKIYDFDFNNYFLRALKYIMEDTVFFKDGLPFVYNEDVEKFDYLFRLRINNPDEKRILEMASQKIDIEIEKLNKERERLKNEAVIIVIGGDSSKYSIISDVLYSFEQEADLVFNEKYKTWEDRIKGEKLYKKRLNKVLKDFGDLSHISIKESPFIAKEIYKLGYNVYIVRKYDFLKYAWLSSIGYMKRKNSKLWWLIMSLCAVNNAVTIAKAKAEGIKVYNVYVDSFQVDSNRFNKIVNREIFPIKVDKEGRHYALVLPPLYYLEKPTRFFVEQTGYDAERFWDLLLNGGKIEPSDYRVFFELKGLCWRYRSIWHDWIDLWEKEVKPQEKIVFYNKFRAWNEEWAKIDIKHMNYNKLHEKVERILKL